MLVMCTIELQQNGLLQVLNLSWNGFSLEGAKALGEALKVNSTLEQLDISLVHFYHMLLLCRDEICKNVVYNWFSHAGFKVITDYKNMHPLRSTVSSCLSYATSLP